jgi:hypothetical protein
MVEIHRARQNGKRQREEAETKDKHIQSGSEKDGKPWSKIQ